ncbi:MAG: riboflavin biosynthesis protein RibF [Deltaproteobacteria bacterium]|nr:riboflavin biosynthesis protein RibF [Deltaproteobacteria bacterium]
MSSSGLIATLGNFDGVHRGHQLLLSRILALKQKNESMQSALISFYPHPALVLGKTGELKRLSCLHDTVEQLERLSLDILYLIRFTPQFATLTAEQFINAILIDALNVRVLVVGPDARIGRGGEGDSSVIAEAMMKAGRSVEIAPFLSEHGSRISSRQIRGAVSKGDMHEAAKGLGRPYLLRGRVVPGAGRGSKIGIPTANLTVLGRNKLIPPNGVYAARAEVNGQHYPAAVNIGTRPTFESSGAAKIEAHLLNFQSRPLYGERVALKLVQKLRDEQKFSSAESLLSQVLADIERVRKVLQ